VHVVAQGVGGELAVLPSEDVLQAPPPPFRSWPYPRDRLERIAFRLGMDDEELRALLAHEVERRRAIPPPGLPGSNGGNAPRTSAISRALSPSSVSAFTATHVYPCGTGEPERRRTPPANGRSAHLRFGVAVASTQPFGRGLERVQVCLYHSPPLPASRHRTGL
jgi:hypothetical protein